MSDTGSAQQEPRDRDPWAPPERGAPLDGRVPLGKGPDAVRPPGHAAVPPQAPPPQAPRPTEGVVPPVPLAPTGPGTPSAWRPPAPYGTPAGFPNVPRPGAPYGPAYPAYGAAPQGPGPYAGPGPAYAPGYPGGPGLPVYHGPVAPMAPAVPDNGFGTAALVLGIVSLVLAVSVVLGLVLGVLAVIFGAVGRAKAVRGVATNRGQALAGLILGALGLAASVAMLVLVLNTPDDPSHDDPYGDDPDITEITDVTYRASGPPGAVGGYAAGASGRGPLVPSASR
ncbi:DUF4190 domain-containing protein [Streptomyces sp. CA-181903]|uniref:DUF4190 domain-containing protein n=1 Tax=Streptomyces sp. CA-181903 TaxID=3240055 RepID=UPI003D91EF50